MIFSVSRGARGLMLIGGCMLFGAGCAGSLFASRGGVPEPASSVTSSAKEQGAPSVGGDRDAHGCIGSAGYRWCSSKQACFRPWEQSCPEGVPSSDVTILTSAQPSTMYCNGAEMDSEGYRRSLTVPRVISVSSTDSFVDYVQQVAIAAAEGTCKEVLRQGRFVFKDGAIHVPPIEGWAGVSIALCHCKPEVEVNVLRITGVDRVVWD